MVGRDIGLSIRDMSGQTDCYRAQRGRYKLFHPAPLRNTKYFKRQHSATAGRADGAARKAIGRINIVITLIGAPRRSIRSGSRSRSNAARAVLELSPGTN